MIQKKLQEGKLLNVYGSLSESGYAKSLVKEYKRSDIKASKYRIKEWDYYYVGSDEYGIALTICDNSYMGLGSVSILDFRNKTSKTKSVMKLFPMGRMKLPETSTTGKTIFKSKKLNITFEKLEDKRILKGEFINFDQGFDLSFNIELLDEMKESMVIATPFEKKKHFYYNQKINCFNARGKAIIGGRTYNFFKGEAFGVLDWGRGVWTYKNTWYWASMNGMHEGKRIGFNLGYGFGENNDATENMIFYDGKAYKIDTVTFHIPKINGKEDYMQEWKFTSNDLSIDLKFKPIINRKDNINLLVLKSLQNQVFGTFTGLIAFEDEVIEIIDMIGFAEKVTNWW